LGWYDPAVPKLACHVCGRQLYTVAPLEALFAEDRRCPRCGAALANERRLAGRRQRDRRVTPPDDPGPPTGAGERRLVERRRASRRGTDRGALRA
jgi:ribosomal protein S27AE